MSDVGNHARGYLCSKSYNYHYNLYHTFIDVKGQSSDVGRTSEVTPSLVEFFLPTTNDYNDARGQMSDVSRASEVTPCPG